MKSRRMSQMTDAERERLMSLAGSSGEAMAKHGAEKMQKSLYDAGAKVGKLYDKQADTQTIKTVESPAEEMESLEKIDNSFDMQEPEMPGIADSFKQERKRRMRARLFTA